VLKAMNKGHQHIPDIREAARKCQRAGIRVTLNLIFGYPGEEERHRRETLRVMSDIAADYDNVTFSPNIFVPYPGIPIWPELKSRGIIEPNSLMGWADIDLGRNTLPWLRGRTYASLQRGISYFVLDNQLSKARRKSKSAMLQTLLRALRVPLHWRLRNYSFDWPVELWFSMAQKWLVVRRSLLTGQALNG
jgi:anaerobic magnesium-protoporphyrin IX monomethyl ester cyclase